MIVNYSGLVTSALNNSADFNSDYSQFKRAYRAVLFATALVGRCVAMLKPKHNLFISSQMNFISKTTQAALSLTALASLTVVVTLAFSALTATAQTPGKTVITGDAERGAEQFETTCAECHGPAATAPTLRGIIDRPIASVASFYGYSEALKAKQPMKWTTANLDAYLKSPPTFAPGNNMYRDYPDAQMRADIIAFLATLPPPRQ